MYWYVGVSVEDHDLSGASGLTKYSRCNRARAFGPNSDAPSIAWVGTMPTASRIVGSMSMFAVSRSSVAPGSTYPGQRRKNGTWIDCVYGNRFSTRPCSPQRNPLSEVNIAIVFVSPSAASLSKIDPTMSSTDIRVLSCRARRRFASFNDVVQHWTQGGLSVRSDSRNAGFGSHFGRVAPAYFVDGVNG